VDARPKIFARQSRADEAHVCCAAVSKLDAERAEYSETAGKTGAVQTFQDLLKSPNDENLFEYYATSQLAVVGVDGKIREIGEPAMFDEVQNSPDGNYILVSRVQRPFSYLFPFSRFPKEVEVWDMNGKSVYKVASVPLQDNLSIQGVPTTPRSYGWIPTETATLVWAEALDQGNPKNKADFRDKLMKNAAPFSSAPVELIKIPQRFQGRAFGERNGLMLFYDYNRDTQRRRIFSIDYRNPGDPRMISDLNVNDRYGDIGQPVTKRLPNGFSVILQNGDEIFMTGSGASPEGDRPFLRRYNLATNKQTQEIWRSGNTEFESFVALMDDGGTRFLTRKESPLDPPNLYLRTSCPANANCETPPRKN
jgi:dipeptidyl aminopeptidase/acylaminoacyl peptidase